MGIRVLYKIKSLSWCCEERVETHVKEARNKRHRVNGSTIKRRDKGAAISKSDKRSRVCMKESLEVDIEI